MKSENYESHILDDMERLEFRMKRLSKEVRIHVKYIHKYAIFSREWVEVAESLKQIAELAFSEKLLPVSGQKDFKNIQGRKNHGTLWDQEKDEVALRILLEEGKLNLCLRLLLEITEYQAKPNFHSIVESACNTEGMDPDIMLRVVETMEKGLGLIMLFAIQHVEALQICDVSSLINLCNMAFQNMDEKMQTVHMHPRMRFHSSYNSEDKLQINLVFHYLHHLINHIPNIQESLIVPKIINNRLFSKSISKINKHIDRFPLDTRVVTAKFINGICKSDAFRTDKSSFIYSALHETLFKFYDHLGEALKVDILRESEISEFKLEIYNIRNSSIIEENSEVNSNTKNNEKNAWNDLVTMFEETNLEN